MAKRKFDDETEEARRDSIKSYRRLVDKAFANIMNDTSVVYKASMAMKSTGKLVGCEEDEEIGEYMSKMMDALNGLAKALKEKYIEKFEGAPRRKDGISDEDWARLDKALENAPYDTDRSWMKKKDEKPKNDDDEFDEEDW